MIISHAEKFDKNYNPILPKEEIYSDEMGETIVELIKLRDTGQLSAEVTKFLISFVIAKEAKKETKDLIEWAVAQNKPETRTMYVNLSTKKYA